MLQSALLALCLCAGTILAKPALDESAAKQFIIESSDKFLELYNNIAKIIYNFSDLPSDDDSDENLKKSNTVKNKVSESSSSKDRTSDEINGFSAFLFILSQMGKLQEGLENVTTLSEEACKFPVDQFTDEEVKIGIMKLKTIGTLALGSEEYLHWKADDFDDLLGNENFCKFNVEETECKTKYNHLYKTLKNSNNPDEILYYWKEWRERNLEESTKKLKIFFKLFDKVGEKLQKSAKFAWFGEFLDENLGDEMENVVNELHPLYKELHAYVRYNLHLQCGSKVPANGLIPHHLYEQALAQAWKPDSIASKEFKGIKMPIENNFKETAKEVMEISSNFMMSLGLSNIPQEFWTERVKEAQVKGENCEAELYDSGNATYFKYCNEVNVRRFLQMHGYISRIYYANERKNLPFAYTEPYNLDLAVSEAVILSATTPQYLYGIGHKTVDILPEKEDMNRLFRMGIHSLLSIPEYFVNAKVIADVLDKTVPFEEMNKHYWDLMKNHVGVAPSAERTPQSIDFPQNFYINIESNQQTIKFVTEVIGYQIYEALCKKGDKDVKNDGKPLHLRNFYNDKTAGMSLKHMMELGAKKSWKKILGTLTGDNNGMKAGAMLEYFKPLQDWLHSRNIQNGVTIGW